VIPPGASAEFVSRMEDVLEVYRRPYDADRPVVCMDEQPVQMVRETRAPIPAAPGRPERIDYEYERNGTANVFMFAEPLAGRRDVHVRDRKTAVDWAEEIRWLLEERSPEAERVVVVCDNLNTHDVSSLYAAFPPARARALVERLEIHFTPKHGSWLNVAECELSALTRQCLSRRIPDRAVLEHETSAWNEDRDARAETVQWQFTTDDARVKLQHLYPQFEH